MGPNIVVLIQSITPTSDAVRQNYRRKNPQIPFQNATKHLIGSWVRSLVPKSITQNGQGETTYFQTLSAPMGSFRYRSAYLLQKIKKIVGLNGFANKSRNVPCHDTVLDI